MAAPLTSPGRMLRDAWARLSPLPGGRRLFSLFLGRLVPYTGSLGAQVERLEPGRAVVTLADRRAIRNHLGSIHAVALTNLAEVTSGLAMLAGLPDTSRAIVTNLSISFLKKARGTLIAECNCRPPAPDFDGELALHAFIHDSSGDSVARAEVRWLVRPENAGPRPPRVSGQFTAPAAATPSNGDRPSGERAADDRAAEPVRAGT